MSDTQVSEERLRATKPWPLFAYAPGDYNCRCVTCGEMFVGDKRAVMCLECAARQAKALLTLRGAGGVPEPMAQVNWAVEGMPVKAPGRAHKGRVASPVAEDGRVYVDYPAGGGAYWQLDQLQPWDNHRDVLGRLVRNAWIRWARTQPHPKPSWLVPYDNLDEADKEADRQIGEAIASAFPPIFRASPPEPEHNAVPVEAEAQSKILAVFAQWALAHATLDEIADLERRMGEVNVSLENVGRMSAALIPQPAPVQGDDQL